MLFDTHAHYDDERFDEDREALLRAMPEKGVGLIVNPGCDLPSSRMAVDMAQKYDFLYAAVGIHPENCGDFAPAMMDGLRALAKAPKVVAIGEAFRQCRGRCGSRCACPAWGRGTCRGNPSR